MDGDYRYLTKMPMDSVTQENVDAILREKSETEQTLQTLKNTTVEQMWIRELTHFEEVYAEYKVDREKIQQAIPPKPKSKGVPKTAKTVARKSA